MTLPGNVPFLSHGLCYAVYRQAGNNPAARGLRSLVKNTSINKEEG